MKLFRTICLALVALAIIKVSVRAASILDEITVAPVAAIKSEGITGASTFGAGLDLGVGINKFVSIHAASLAFESDSWRSSTIDESEIYGRANFVKFAKEKFVFYGKGGVVRDWNDEAWATSVGLGADLRVAKNVALAADYSIRAWFSDREKNSLARALISISF